MFVIYDILKIFEEKADWLTEWINELITKVFVQQPRLHRVC